jgi:murein biosynthesis integral membrane protein MurJ
VLAGGVVQINLIVGRQVASFTENAISWLSYADRLYQLPLGVVGIAVGVVLLPELSRRLREGEDLRARDAFSRGMEFALALTVPSAVALVVIAQPIVSVLFERGAFGRIDTVNTALALAVYGAGLPAFVLHKVLQPLYFAREDTRTPFRYAVNSMFVNVMTKVVIASAARTAVGSFGGAFANTPAHDLGAAVIWPKSSPAPASTNPKSARPSSARSSPRPRARTPPARPISTRACPRNPPPGRSTRSAARACAPWRWARSTSCSAMPPSSPPAGRKT